MNPTIKERFYGKGNRKQVIYLSRAGGLKPLEAKMLWCWHFGLADERVEEILSLTADSRKILEARVSEKITAAMLHCVDITIEHDPYFLNDAIFQDDDCFPPLKVLLEKSA